MIDVKIATNQAINYLKDIYKEGKSIRLEEVELSEDGKFWFITLSFVFEDVLFASPQRVYKLLKVSSEDGQVMAMKIRKIDD